MTEFTVRTESGTVYVINTDENWWTTSDRLSGGALWEFKSLDPNIDESKIMLPHQYHDDDADNPWTDIRHPVLGQRMYLHTGRPGGWRISTLVVEVTYREDEDG